MGATSVSISQSVRLVIAMLRSAFKEAAGWLVRSCYLRLFPLRGFCVVLMCHRVVEPEDITPWNQDIALSPAALSLLLKGLGKHFQPVDLYEWLKEPRTSSPTFAVTFDDGWRDNHSHALPVLREHSVPATVFVTVGMVETSEQFWWDRIAHILKAGRVDEVAAHFSRECSGVSRWSTDPLDVYRVVVGLMKTLPQRRIDELVATAEHKFGIQLKTERVMLTWKELAEMGRSNVSIGSHGMTHSILVPLSDEEKWSELAGSALVLSRTRLPYVPIMCFPNGTFDQRTVDISLKCGYQALVTAGTDPCATTGGPMVNRIAVNAKTSVNSVFLQILSAHVRGTLLSAKELVARRLPGPEGASCES